ncbi:NYN domain-containing protein [Dolichospermum circinale CS-537/01]|uniref:NYN domain-containing protein n=1 Tax=Dolichospermum circinale CS-537/01 TaxID=3021739 RepID=A0ABT4ZZD4_9CYAN|nr:NYN domain-containing protein [Dolichospermum circinale]MDB9485034.1 NYN domain-containing protein [Dolichospermum circinale CS-537/01]
MIDKVGIFLDIENLAGWLKLDGGETLLDRASELGSVVVRRAYGDFSLPSVSKRQSELNLLGFEFVHVYHPVKGKNSADIQIVVDVMEYLTRVPDLQWFVLATGDADFSPLFRRLKELGKSVVGIGPKSKLSEVVKKSCNRFIYTDTNVVNIDIIISSVDNKELQESSLELLEKILNRNTDEIAVSVLKTAILELDPSFDERNFGYSKFLSFLKSVPDIVTLRLDKQKTTWFAKSAEDNNDEIKISSEDKNNQNVNIQPTTDLYKRLLKKIGLRLCRKKLLCEAIVKLNEKFQQTFSTSEQLEFLFDTFDNLYSRGEIRAASFLLYKSGYIVKNDDVNHTANLYLITTYSQEDILVKIDKIILSYLSYIYYQCQNKNINILPDLCMSLMMSNFLKNKNKIQEMISQCKLEQK